MVRAIIDGTKTQTRRIVKPQVINVGGSAPWEWKGTRPKAKSGTGWIASTDLGELLSWLKYSCPYGKPGDTLWVRETWDFRDWSDSPDDRQIMLMYGADGEQRLAIAPEGWNPMVYGHERWRPSIHMPRWASRITLEVESVRVERLQAISEADAIAEGIKPFPSSPSKIPVMQYQDLWESINGPGSWEANPWVWVITFKRVKP